jgi:subtilisin family serine protease
LEIRQVLSADAGVFDPIDFDWRGDPHASAAQLAVVTDDGGANSEIADVYEWWRGQTFTVGDVTPLEMEFSTDTLSFDGSLETYDAQAWNLINLFNVRAEYAFNGAGYSVAIIDTGIDYNHPALGGGWGNRVIAGWDFVNNDADPMDDHGHGTHVAGIVGSSNATYSGVASGVNLIALKVLGADGAGNFGAVEDALRWVVNHQAQYNIVAVNLSLGAGNFTANPYMFLEDEFAALISQGVFIAAAAGNSYYSYNSQQGLGYPAISNLTVSVGAVFDANVGSIAWSSGARDFTTAPDRIASFSQRSVRLDILAPGALITSTGRNNTFVTMAGTSMAAPVVAGSAVLIRQAMDAYGLSPAVKQAFILNLMKSTGASLIDGDDENDNVVNTGLAFKRIDVYAAISTLAVASNRAPEVAAIPDVVVSYRQAVVQVAVAASDPDGDALTYNGVVLPSHPHAAALDAQYGFFVDQRYLDRNLFYNHRGAKEKYFLGDAGSGARQYFILPDGRVFEFRQSIANSKQVGKVEKACYANPLLLVDASTATPPALLSWTGSTLNIEPVAGFLGAFRVEVSVSDGRKTSVRTFSVVVANSAPTVATISNQTISHTQSSLVLPLNAADADGDALSYSVEVFRAHPLAYQLDARYGFFVDQRYLDRNLFYNHRGAKEKYFLGDDGSGVKQYFITPDGRVFEFRNSIANSIQVGKIEKACYANPMLLVNAADVASPAAASFSGGSLVVEPSHGFLGTFRVEVRVGDGVHNVVRSFTVTVVNSAPTFSTIANMTVLDASSEILVPLHAVDPDGDPLEYAASVAPTYPAAAQLDARYNFFVDQRYLDRNLFYNHRGAKEKYFLGDDGSGVKQYFILSDGRVFQFQQSIAASKYVGKVEKACYADPTRLLGASTAPPPASATFVGDSLALSPADGFVGTFQVRVSVSDGVHVVQQTFAVTVSPSSSGTAALASLLEFDDGPFAPSVPAPPPSVVDALSALPLAPLRDALAPSQTSAVELADPRRTPAGAEAPDRRQAAAADSAFEIPTDAAWNVPSDGLESVAVESRDAGRADGERLVDEALGSAGELLLETEMSF